MLLQDPYPPSKAIYNFYPRGQDRTRTFPRGHELEYLSKVYSDGYVVEGAARSTAEMRERERLADPERPNMIRKAAEVHRRVRRFARDELLRPGMTLLDICEKLENATRVYLEADKSPTAGTRAGIGFPTGVSLNQIAAHYTPNPGDHVVLKYDDVLKLDFGTHVNGYIMYR